MSKKYLTLTIVCWTILLIIVVCWVATYYGLFSMNLRQSLLYIAFFKIDLYQGWSIGNIPTYLTRALRGEFVPSLVSSYNVAEFEQQVQASLVSFHLCFAVLTALFLAGGIVSTILLVKKRR